MNYNQSFASVQQKLRQYAVPVVLLLLVITMIGSGATYAWIVSHAGPITNKFELMSASMNLEETTNPDVNDQITLKQNVHIKNEGEAPLYARIHLVLEAQDADGNPVANPITYDANGNRTDLPLTLENYIAFTGLHGSGWIEVNGTYYYTQQLEGKTGVTSNLFQTATVKSGVYLSNSKDANAPTNATNIVLTVMGETIQKHGVEEAWKAVKLSGSRLAEVAGGRS